MSIDRFAPRPVVADMSGLIEGQRRLPAALELMGFSSLRPAQESVVSTLAAGRDALVIIPTSGGKTATFVIPTLMRGWKALVFSPLQALMRDQVNGLQRRWSSKSPLLRQFGYQDPPVDYMSAQRTNEENRRAAQRWAAGDLALFYVAPERMDNQDFLQAMRTTSPDAVYVDEAHCLSQWGHNFRNAYIRIGDLVRTFNPKVVAAFTATATPSVQTDIRMVLGLQNAALELHWVRRDNLELESRDLHNDADMIRLVKEELQSGTVLIYGTSKNKLGELCNQFGKLFPNDGVGIYHADMTDSEKAFQYEQFMTDRHRIMFATCAFGMGIDKPDIRAVVHYHHPASLEALVQEIGRAGRDQQPSRCITFYSREAANIQRTMVESGNPSPTQVKQFFQYLLRKQSSNGIVKLKMEEMATDSHVSPMHISAMIQVLSGALVIERAKSDDDWTQIAFTGESGEPNFERFRQVVQMLGLPVEGSSLGHLRVEQEQLYFHLRLKEGTVKSWIRNWVREGLLHVIPPFRGSTTRIIGDINQVDFDKLEERARLAWHGLDAVKKYHTVPDSQKHDFLESVFYEDYGKARR